MIEERAFDRSRGGDSVFPFFPSRPLFSTAHFRLTKKQNLLFFSNSSITRPLSRPCRSSSSSSSSGRRKHRQATPLPRQQPKSCSPPRMPCCAPRSSARSRRSRRAPKPPLPPSSRPSRQRTRPSGRSCRGRRRRRGQQRRRQRRRRRRESALLLLRLLPPPLLLPPPSPPPSSPREWPPLFIRTERSFSLSTTPPRRRRSRGAGRGRSPREEPPPLSPPPRPLRPPCWLQAPP